MDIDALHSTLLSIAVASEDLKNEQQKLSSNEHPRLIQSLRKMEVSLREAKATLAAELGFRLCPRCWPPEVLISDSTGRLDCPACNEISYQRAA